MLFLYIWSALLPIITYLSTSFGGVPSLMTNHSLGIYWTKVPNTKDLFFSNPVSLFPVAYQSFPLWCTKIPNSNILLFVLYELFFLILKHFFSYMVYRPFNYQSIFLSFKWPKYPLPNTTLWSLIRFLLIILHYLPIFEKYVHSSTSKIPNTILSYQTFNNNRFNAWLPATKQSIIRAACTIQLSVISFCSVMGPLTLYTNVD
jgi:hypothetical protein